LNPPNPPKSWAKEGCVHGRFQPFHLEHLEYALAAKGHCDYLWIGITQYDLDDLGAGTAEQHRTQRSSNPMTYLERVQAISASLQEAGIPVEEYGFTPFPIDAPQKLSQFVSTEVICFTTICEPWNEIKIERLRSLGYKVHVLWERMQKQYSGTEIRRLIESGSSDWHEMVPPSVVKVIQQLDLAARLRRG